MEILNSENSLSNHLLACSNKTITIVSAFVSGIKPHIIKLLGKNNKVKLFTGILNYFNSPEDLMALSELSKSSKGRFEFNVCFSLKNSTHWKLYLISDKIVIVGSANYTSIGVELSRDTMLKVANKLIYDQYMASIAKSSEYVKARDKSFATKLNQYISNRKSNPLPSQMADDLDEVNTDIPIFIWENLMDREERENILELANECNESSSEEFKINRNMVKDYFKFPSNYDYKVGQKVLCTRINGKNMAYFVFDQIIEHEDIKYAISLKNGNRSKNPISIPKEKTPKLIKLLKELHKDEATSVSLNQLKEVV